jgi:hypothetical protein
VVVVVVLAMLVILLVALAGARDDFESNDRREVGDR